MRCELRSFGTLDRLLVSTSTRNHDTRGYPGTMKLPSRQVLFWLAVSGILIAALAVVLWVFVYPVWQQASAKDVALRLVETAPTGPEWLNWQTDDPTLPRQLEQSRRDEIALQYLLAQRELQFARLGGDVSGLRTYFQEGALRDALDAARQPRARVVGWDHRLKLRFYAPDGATVSFTDTYWTVQALEPVVKSPPQFEDMRFSRRTLDVVMQLDDGNWRIHHWRVTEETALKRDRTFPNLEPELTAVRGVNYVGRTHPFEDFWPTFNVSEVRSSFALAAQLNLNTVRIFVTQPVLPETVKHLPELLEIARAAKLRVIVTLLDGYTDYKLEDLPQIWRGIAQLLPALRHPNVLAIDVKNEAERDVKRAGWDQVRATLGFLATRLRSETGKPTTAGLTDPDPALSSNLDFVTLHHYGSPERLEARIQSARTTGKPVLLEEFGFHTWRAKLPDPHTELEQASYYTRTLEFTKRERIGFLAWTLHDFADGTMPGSRQVERHLGIARADGSLKPVAFVLQGEAVPVSDWWDKLGKLEAYLRLILPAVVFGILALVLTVRIRSRKSVDRSG